MASKQQNDTSPEEVDELLDVLDKTLDRLKSLYEQYFLGIQKQPPAFIHNDVERRIRDLQQMQLRNTGLRYRFATLQQKFGAYNSYWRRTLREIENGTYKRNLSKIGREAVRTGAEIPEEILAAMPKRMREQVVRDREQALATAKRRSGTSTKPPEPTEELVAMIKEPTALRISLREQAGALVIDESDGDIDIDAFFREVQQGTIPPPMGKANMEKLARAARPDTEVDPAELARTRKLPRVETDGDAQELARTQKLPRAETLAGLPGGAVRAPTPPAGVPVVAPPPPIPSRGAVPTPAASQSSRPNPIAPGSAAARGPIEVESMAGPFPRARTEAGTGAPTPAPPRPPIPPPPRPPIPPPPRPQAPAGMSDADVNALYAKYVKAKESVGEKIGPGEHAKLLKTINQQAPKIMEQYKAKGVEFSVVVKDNQVVIRAKPKT